MIPRLKEQIYAHGPTIIYTCLLVPAAADQSGIARIVAAASPDLNPSTRTQGGENFRGIRQKWILSDPEPTYFLHETLELHNTSVQKYVDGVIGVSQFVLSRARVGQLTRADTAYQR